MSSLKSKISALAASAALAIGAALTAATPAQAASSLTVDGCTVTATKPTWDASRALLGWRVNSYCLSTGIYQMNVRVYEDDLNADDFMFSSLGMGWLHTGNASTWGNGRIKNTEVGYEEIYYTVQYQVKRGGPWRTITSPTLSVWY